MGTSTGSRFPTSGINPGHVHFDTTTRTSWMYVGGDATDSNNWVLMQSGSAETTQLQGIQGDLGDSADAAVTDPTASASLVAALKGLLTQLQGSGSGSAPVDMATALSSEYDSINVGKQSKGSVTTAHSAITGTATSNEIDCRGFNAISVEMACSAFSEGNWVASILGCAVSGGTFGVCYQPKDDGTFVAQATPAISADGNTTYYFRGIPNYVKILATRTTDGTLTCKVTPMNL